MLHRNPPPSLPWSNDLPDSEQRRPLYSLTPRNCRKGHGSRPRRGYGEVGGGGARRSGRSRSESDRQQLAAGQLWRAVWARLASDCCLPQLARTALKSADFSVVLRLMEVRRNSAACYPAHPINSAHPHIPFTCRAPLAPPPPPPTPTYARSAAFKQS